MIIRKIFLLKRRENSEFFQIIDNKYSTLIGKESYSIVANAFLSRGITAEQYFLGLSEKTNKSFWDNAYNRYF